MEWILYNTDKTADRLKIMNKRTPEHETAHDNDSDKVLHRTLLLASALSSSILMIAYEVPLLSLFYKWEK